MKPYLPRPADAHKTRPAAPKQTSFGTIYIAQIAEDAEYRDELRHRFETDHFFAAEILGFDKFIPELHKPAVDLYFPKNKNLKIEDQHPVKYRLHLDPRHSFKSTLGKVDTAQWVAAFPELITILNESATQPLAEALSLSVAKFFWQKPGNPPTVLQALYPHIVTSVKPDAKWDTACHAIIEMDHTLDYTSPKSTQAGWHPWILNPDDLCDAINSGIHAEQSVRRTVIDTYYVNKNLLRHGGYINIRGTRYHPFELYGDVLSQIEKNPPAWKVLIRGSLTVISGEPLMPGVFPSEDQVILHFPQLLSYEVLREKFHENYESFMCFRAGSKVLMADWTEKPIQQLTVGDEVIGFEKTKSHQIKFVKTPVVRTFARRAEVAKVTTDTGRITYPTFDHKFLRPMNGDERYIKLKVGSKLVSVYTPEPPPTLEQQRDLDWLGGMIDGEGGVDPGAVHITQSKRVNREVYEGIVAALMRLDIPYSSPPPAGKNRAERVSILGGRSLMIRLLQHARMSKRERFLKQLWASQQLAETAGRGGGSTYPIVETMESIGNAIVYDIETGTHNFICDGFAVHNCQQQNDPRGGSVSVFGDRLYGSVLMAPDRIPPMGDTVTCWRLPYGGKDYMSKHAEGAAARIWNGRVYVLDAWQGIFTPSGLAEKIVRELKHFETPTLMLEAIPGTEYMESHIKNEAIKRNVSLRFQWFEFEEDDNVRQARLRQLEPQMQSGRIFISSALSKSSEIRRQFVHFGLVEENGIVDVISRIAARVPASTMRQEISAEEIELQERRRQDAMFNMAFGQPGVRTLQDDAELARQQLASMRALTVANGLPSFFGLDG